jgi:hypothetical protein
MGIAKRDNAYRKLGVKKRITDIFIADCESKQLMQHLKSPDS